MKIYKKSVKPKILAIIPARGGSKGIPRKNIRNICGKPLIAYSIEVALRSKLIDRVIVTTEDEEIAHISTLYGAEVPFLRPKVMAKDDSNIGEGIIYTVDRLRNQGYDPNILVTLYPTHPFRTPGLVDFLISKTFVGYTPIETVKRVSHSRLTIFTKNGKNRLKPLLNLDQGNKTITIKPFFRFYGLVKATKYNSPRRPYLHVIKDKISLIDIDTPSDFYLAEEVIRQGLFDFTNPLDGI